MDTYYTEKLDTLAVTINEVKISSKDTAAKKEKELTDLINASVNKMMLVMETNLADIIVERKITLEKNKKQFVDIKQVCCKFFEKYDL